MAGVFTEAAQENTDCISLTRGKLFMINSWNIP